MVGTDWLILLTGRMDMADSLTLRFALHSTPDVFAVFYFEYEAISIVITVCICNRDGQAKHSIGIITQTTVDSRQSLRCYTHIPCHVTVELTVKSVSSFLRKFTVVIMLLVLSACSGNNAANNAATPVIYRDVPFPSRELSWETQKTVIGSDADQRSAGAIFDFFALRLQSQPGGREYGVYRLNAGTPPPQPLTVTINLKSDTADPSTWIAIANFDSHRWQFQGPFLTSQTLALTSNDLSPLGNVWVAVLVADGAENSIESVSMAIEVPGDLPLADLTSTSPSSIIGIPADLNASGSKARPEGSIAGYEWDLDDNGVFNEPGDELTYKDQAGALITREDPGNYTVHVRVTDDLSQTASASLTLRFSGSLKRNIKEDGDAGSYSSLAVIDGKPAICYYEAESKDLVYAYSSSGDGKDLAGWSFVTVDSDGDVGSHASLALINGKPAISYRDVDNGDLKYAYSSMDDGSSGWTTLMVDGTDNVGEYTSLALIDGKPAISYRDVGNLHLKYAYSSQTDGSSGWTTLVVDNSTNAGAYTSLALVNGKPAISYNISGSVEVFSALKYALSSSADGSAGWTTVPVDAPAEVGHGSYTSLAVVDGRPAISYANTSGSAALQYARSSSVDGANSADWSILLVDFNVLPFYTSLAVVKGKPAIAYYDFTNKVLRYAHSSKTDGSSGWSSFAVDEEPGSVGTYCSLAEVDGQAAISYYFELTGDLRYAIPDLEK
jgi:hypothetical protein